MMRIGIVGYGTVGAFLQKLFSNIAADIVIYDKFKEPYNTLANLKEVNNCDLVFIAVPTPMTSIGTCDISAVEDVVSWIEPPACIKSTVIPGTTDMLVKATGKRLVFSPEYVGETPFHRYNATPQLQDLVAIGGDVNTAKKFLELYKIALGPHPRYFLTDAISAELSKYMENCFFATKVAFVAQFHDLARQFGADFDQVREIWVADTRVGSSHSIIVDKPGFGGACLPKDLSAIIFASEPLGGAPLLEAVMSFNKALHKSNDYESRGELNKCLQSTYKFATP